MRWAVDESFAQIMTHGPAQEPLGGRQGSTKDEESNFTRRINVFCEDFDASVALKVGANAIAETFSSQRDRAIFSAAEVLNHIGLCSSVKDAPFRELRARPVRAVGTRAETNMNTMAGSKTSGGDAEGIKQGQVKKFSSKGGLKVTVRGGNFGRLENILSRMMDDCVQANGPLSVLAKAVSLRLRVCVKIRERHCIRSFVQGRLVAFDKHMNMVLRDAKEVFVDGKLRPRLLPLTLLRGEHVVIVSMMKPTGTNNSEHSNKQVLTRDSLVL